jgi:DTW domain-containing protein YfiP
MHHKEICLAVDTAKLILAAFPETCRLVVGGIGSEYQDSMKELEEAASDNHCLVLFPTEEAEPFEALQKSLSDNGAAKLSGKWDVIVIDGTWTQAQKLCNRYIPSEQEGGPCRVRLRDEAKGKLSDSNGDGHQLRRHPVKWREISTLEATRLLLGDMHRG